jgi:hypothetical protein
LQKYEGERRGEGGREGGNESGRESGSEERKGREGKGGKRRERESGRDGEQHLFFGLNIILDCESIFGLLQKRVPVVGRIQPVSNALLFYYFQIIQRCQHPR